LPAVECIHCHSRGSEVTLFFARFNLLLISRGFVALGVALAEGCAAVGTVTKEAAAGSEYRARIFLVTRSLLSELKSQGAGIGTRSK